MKKLSFTLLPVLLLLTACHTDTPSARQSQSFKSAPPVSEGRMMDQKYCSFQLPDYLHLRPITNPDFTADNYIKIGSDRSASMMQIFLFTKKIDPEAKIDAQERALNSPDVFTAESTVPVRHFSKYSGSGIAMTGVYKGGVVRGKIMVFAYGEGNKGFLVIQQSINGANDFGMVDRSFTLK